MSLKTMFQLTTQPIKPLFHLTTTNFLIIKIMKFISNMESVLFLTRRQLPKLFTIFIKMVPQLLKMLLTNSLSLKLVQKIQLLAQLIQNGLLHKLSLQSLLQQFLAILQINLKLMLLKLTITLKILRRQSSTMLISKVLFFASMMILKENSLTLLKTLRQMEQANLLFHLLFHPITIFQTLTLLQ